MQPVVTWYDILDVLPGASTEEIQDKYDAKASLLRPELIAGAPSAVITAVSRAQQLLDAARRVLGDPAARARYDAVVGIRRSDGGLAPEESFPSEPGWGPEDFDLPVGTKGTELLGGLMALTPTAAGHCARRPGTVLSRVPADRRQGGASDQEDPAHRPSHAGGGPSCRPVSPARHEGAPGQRTHSSGLASAALTAGELD